MSEHFLTKCPHCSTTFRLTQEQLDIAGGAVRCGACYQVFHANEYIVKTSVVEEHREVTQKRDPVEEAFDMENDEGLDPYESSDLDFEDSESKQIAREVQIQLDEEPEEAPPSPSKTTKAKSAEAVDESWAEELLRELGEDVGPDDSETDEGDEQTASKSAITSSEENVFGLDDEHQPQKKKTNSGAELSDTFKNLGQFDDDDPFSIDDLDEDEYKPDSNVDESWAKALLEELEQEDSPPSSNKLSLQEEDNDPNKTVLPDATFSAPITNKKVKQKKVEKTPPPTVPPTTPPKKPESIGAINDDADEHDEVEEFIGLLEDSPETGNDVEDAVFEEINIDDVGQLDELQTESLFTEDHSSSKKKSKSGKQAARKFASQDRHLAPLFKSFYAIGSILLMCSIGLQYAYFNFEDVAREPRLRPFVEKACHTLGCSLPNQVDVSKIIGTNLVVRSHPTHKNALAIDVILKNKASFQQPYPLIQFNFEDVNGNPIASRRFKPEEYIQDELLNQTLMPSNVPIHLTLEIIDPGRNAVNYHIEFIAVKKTS